MLHVMAQGGRIVLERDDQGKIVEAICLTRDGWALTGFTLELFKKTQTAALHRIRQFKPLQDHGAGHQIRTWSD